MRKAVLDTTILVSAFLRNVPGGASHDLLRFADEGAFDLYLSEEILEETAGVLFRQGRHRQRYAYSDEDVVEYCQELTRFATVVGDVPEIRGIVARDPNDDMIIACALAAEVDYLVTRDKDLLSLGQYEVLKIVTPEAFLPELRTGT
jgi:putative PIN family toxin of toxin-antitoxin system